MSTIVTDTLQGKTSATSITLPTTTNIGATPLVSASANSLTIRGEGSATTSIQQGLCKAWTNSSNAAVRNDSFNMDGQTDHGTGTYSYELINHMSGVNNYAQAGMARSSGDGRIITRDTANDSASAIAIECTGDDHTKADMSHDLFIVGDLA